MYSGITCERNMQRGRKSTDQTSNWSTWQNVDEKICEKSMTKGWWNSVIKSQREKGKKFDDKGHYGVRTRNPDM